MYAILMPRHLLTLATVGTVSDQNILHHTKVSNGDMLMIMIC